jgi:hypothetical protein
MPDERRSTAITVEEYESWLTPTAALKKLEHLRGSASKAILERLRYGHIRAVARRYNYRGRSGECFAVPMRIWEEAGHRVGASSFWSTGDITLFIDDHRFALFSVRFDPAGLEEILSSDGQRMAPAETGRTEAQPVVTNRGGRPPKEWWSDLWVEMARQLYEGDLQPKRQAEIEKAMADWISAEGYDASERTIRDAARKLWRTINREGRN